jgi:acyl CoA:acetate/3-ketoacid CoA transferase alpha subunit
VIDKQVANLRDAIEDLRSGATIMVSGFGGAGMPRGLVGAVLERAPRNFGPVMAMAAKVVVAEVDEVVEPGDVDPEVVVTPGVLVDRVVLGNPAP